MNKATIKIKVNAIYQDKDGYNYIKFKDNHGHIIKKGLTFNQKEIINYGLQRVKKILVDLEILTYTYRIRSITFIFIVALLLFYAFILKSFIILYFKFKGLYAVYMLRKELISLIFF